VKAHAGIYGDETADRLAKEATQNYYVTYSRIPKSAIKIGDPGRKYKKMAELKKKKKKKRIFPSVERRLAVNLHLNPNVTTIISGHRNLDPTYTD
jgi:hypothetical protein